MLGLEETSSPSPSPSEEGSTSDCNSGSDSGDGVCARSEISHILYMYTCIICTCTGI